MLDSPSPKSHFQLVIVPVDKSVKRTRSGGAPSKGPVPPIASALNSGFALAPAAGAALEDAGALAAEVAVGFAAVVGATVALGAADDVEAGAVEAGAVDAGVVVMVDSTTEEPRSAKSLLYSRASVK